MSGRRDFIIDAALLATACCAGALTASLAGCTGVKYLSATVDGQKLRVNRADIGENKYVVIQYAGLSAPVYLNAGETVGNSALLMKCTHKGCEVRPTGSFLTCPCHGAEFSNQGQVLKGPAMQGLKRFKTSTDNEYIYIHLS